MEVFGIRNHQHQFEVTRYTTTAPVPAAGEIVVRTLAAGAFQDDMQHCLTQRDSWRVVPGRSVCGCVEVVGADVTDFAMGDIVLGWTKHTVSELTLVAQNDALPLPTGVRPEAAVAIAAPGLSASYAVNIFSAIHPEQHLGICGTTTPTGRIAAGLAHAMDIMVHPASSHARNCDAVIDLVGTQDTADAALAMCRYGGTVASLFTGSPNFGTKVIRYRHIYTDRSVSAGLLLQPVLTLLATNAIVVTPPLFPFTTPGVRAALTVAPTTMWGPVISINA